MPNPFVCRQCIARLASPPVRVSKPKCSRFHTQVSPATRSSAARLFFSEEQTQRSVSTQATDAPALHHGGDATSIATPSEHVQEDTLQDALFQWDGTMRKYVPRSKDMDTLRRLPSANTRYRLKDNILRAKGNYAIVREDLEHVYGISPPEARHAVGQLERLLWGCSRTESAARFDQYHEWKRDFARLLQSVGHSPSNLSSISDDSIVEIWAALQDRSVQAMRAIWQTFNLEKRDRAWPGLVLLALHSRSAMLPTFIRATYDASTCPSYVIEDLVYALFRTGGLLEKRSMDRHACELALFLLESCSPRHFIFEQAVLSKLVFYIHDSTVLDFYQHLKAIEHPLHVNTLLQFASRLAKTSSGKVHAADIIHALTAAPGFDINSPASASVCTSLLTLYKNQDLPDGYAAPDELLRMLVKNGLRPNLLNLSALMRNFCLRGHLEAAWKVFNILQQNGIEPDPHVVSILLNGCRKFKDAASLQRIVNVIQSRNAWSPVLVNDLLSLVVEDNEAQEETRRRQRKKPYGAFRTMFRLYAKFFHLAPLQRFTLFQLENLDGLQSRPSKHSSPITRIVDSIPPLPELELMQPDNITLLLMIGGHMRSLIAPKWLYRNFHHFQKLVEKNDPLALGLLESHGSMVYDIFVRSFMQFKQTIRPAISLVQGILERATAEFQRKGKNRYCPPPSIYTWTILLHGFKNHNHRVGALSVLQLMAEAKGTTPNLATWNALISTFAQTGNVKGAVLAVRYLEAMGFQTDDYTFKAFQHLPRLKRDEVVKLIRKSRERPFDPGNAQVFFSKLWSQGNLWQTRFGQNGYLGFSVRVQDSEQTGLSDPLKQLAEVQRIWNENIQDRKALGLEQFSFPLPEETSKAESIESVGKVEDTITEMPGTDSRDSETSAEKSSGTL